MRLRNLIGGIAVSLFSLLGAAQVAHAQSTCANPVYNNAVNINVTGNCTIGGAIAITGPVNITVTSGNLTDAYKISGSSVTIKTVTSGTVTLQDTVTAATSIVQLTSVGQLHAVKTITATATGGALVASSSAGDIVLDQTITVNNYVSIKSTTGKVTLGGDLVSQVGGGILIDGGKDVLTKNITSGNDTNAGPVQIAANTAGGSDLFEIGSATTNGVAGQIKTSGTTNGGTNTLSVVNGVYIVNGTTGAGGIKLDATTDISVTNSASRSGFIFLDAKDGTLTLPSGTLSADGQNGNYAGLIAFNAAKIAMSGDTTISTTETTNSNGSSHLIWIGTSEIDFGTSLTLHSDGAHLANGLPATVVGPVGSVSFTTSDVSPGLSLQVSINAPTGIVAQEKISSTSSGAFTATADGISSGLQIAGYPLTFNAGSVTVHSRGNGNPMVVGCQCNTTGTTGIDFEVTGNVDIDADALAAGYNGGNLTVEGDQFIFNAPQLNFAVNGPTSGTGNGGTIYFYGQSTTLGANTRVLLYANAAAAGTGNASTSPQAIQFYPGYSDVKLGTNAGEFSFQARGGQTGGNAGSVLIEPFGNLTFDSPQSSAVDISAPGATGNGGTLSLQTPIGGITFSGSAGYTVSADAGTMQGNGGNVVINSSNAISTGTNAGGVVLTARGKGTGNGGSINVTSQGTLSIGANSLLVTAGTGTGSNGSGGSVSLTSTGSGAGGVITLNGSIDASANGSGIQGTINISGAGFSQASTANITDKGAAGKGVTITASNPSGTTTVRNIDTSSSTGSGGPINLTDSGSGSNGILAIQGTLNASGASSGSPTGGNVTISTGSLAAGSSSSITSHGAGGGGTVAITLTDAAGSATLGAIDTSISSGGALSGTVNVNAQSSSGNITQSGGVLTAATLNILAEGNLGSSSQRLQINSSSLNAQSTQQSAFLTQNSTNALTLVRTSKAAGGPFYLFTQGTLTVAGVTASTTIPGSYVYLNGQGGLSVTGSITSDGYVELTSTNGAVSVGGSAVVTAGAGDILINSPSTITINSSVQLLSISSGGTSGKVGQDSHDPVDGDIVILIGSLPPPLVAGTIPSGFTVQTSSPGKVYWGNGSIASGSNNTANADKNDVVFSGGSGANIITIGSGVQISSGGA